MNTLDKNRQSGFGKVLGAWLGCAVLFAGLALPAYGQGISNPVTCTTPRSAPDASGTGSTGNSSSFAAGCDAEAQTDGSIAIGEDATVERYLGNPIPGVTTRMDRLSIPDSTQTDLQSPLVVTGSGVNKTLTGGREYTVTEMRDANNVITLSLYSDSTGMPIDSTKPDGLTFNELITYLEASETSITSMSNRDLRTVFGSTMPSTAPLLGDNAIALGARTSVVGESSVAIGASAQIGTRETTRIVDGVTTRMDRLSIPDSTQTDLQSPLVVTGSGVNKTLTGGREYTVTEMRDANNVITLSLYSDSTGMPIDSTKPDGLTFNELITYLEASETSITSMSNRDLRTVFGSTMPSTVPVSAVPVLRAVAIGADSSVTGDNGVALGAGASAGENGIAFGAGVTAGENEIVIGSADAASVMIGGVDVRENRDKIGTNTTDIATNTTGIATNTTGIATNTTGIATNTKAINTNRSGIAMSVALAHLPTIKGGGWGIAAGTFDSETAVAVGAHFNVQQNAFIKIGAASSGGETSFGIGYGKGF